MNDGAAVPSAYDSSSSQRSVFFCFENSTIWWMRNGHITIARLTAWKGATDMSVVARRQTFASLRKLAPGIHVGTYFTVVNFFVLKKLIQ